MVDMVVITLRPCSNYDFHDLKYTVNLYNDDFNRAVRDAVRCVKKSFKHCPVDSFDVVSIEVV